MLMLFAIFFSSYLLTLVPVRWGIKRARLYKLFDCNYRGKVVVSPGGLFLPPLVGLLILLAGRGLLSPLDIALVIFFISSVFLGGLVDDLYGERDIKGWRGHFSTIRSGKISTGILKVVTATTGGIPLFFIGIPTPVGLILLLGALLGINTFNLLDKRPGRALKALFLTGIYVVLTSPSGTEPAIFSLVLLGAVSAFWRYDLAEEVMLGDSGVGFLGALAMVAFLWRGVNLSFAFFLFVLINILGEFSSLSKIINGNKLLRYCDQLDREKRISPSRLETYNNRKR